MSAGRLGMDVDGLRALRRARDRIDRDDPGALSIEVLAAEVGYSPGHFIRAFGAAYGETPGRYRTRRRIERACELLRSVNLDVTEVCLLVGFTSLGTFSRRFSELVGRSPSAYRRQAARVGGPAPVPGCFALMWRTGLPAAGPSVGPVATPGDIAVSKKRVQVPSPTVAAGTNETPAPERPGLTTPTTRRRP